MKQKNVADEPKINQLLYQKQIEKSKIEKIQNIANCFNFHYILKNTIITLT